MAINLRSMFYSRRSNENWKGNYVNPIKGSVAKMVHNSFTTPNVRRANPMKHWRKQSSSSGLHSKLNLMNEINKPGGVVVSSVDRCDIKKTVIMDDHLSKNTGCCNYEQNKALQLTRHYTKGINQNIKYGNNDLKSNECHDNSNRYYHHTGSYLERKKQRILNKEKENTLTSTVDCKLAQQCMDPHEKYYEIHGFNRSEPAVDAKCKC